MNTGVSTVAAVTSGGIRVRIRLAWTYLRAWSLNLLRACFGEVLCLTAGEVN